MSAYSDPRKTHHIPELSTVTVCGIPKTRGPQLDPYGDPTCKQCRKKMGLHVRSLAHDVLNCRRDDLDNPCPDCAAAAPFLAREVIKLRGDVLPEVLAQLKEPRP